MKKQNKLDEMDLNIQLRSQALAYKIAVLTLSMWIILNSYQVFVNKEKFQIIPVLILCLISGVEYFSKVSLKQKMVSGDDEYEAPNKVLQFIVLCVAIVAIIVFIGTWLLAKGY